jgi:hypothetical protein
MAIELATDFFRGLSQCQTDEERKRYRDEWRRMFDDERADIEEGASPEQRARRKRTLQAFKEIAVGLNAAGNPKKFCRLVLVGFEDIPGFIDLFMDEFVMILKGDTLKRKSKPRKWTPDLITEARTLCAELKPRMRALKQFYNRNSKSGAWQRHIAIEDAQEHPEGPKLPQSIIAGLPFNLPRDLAHEWTAAELNRRHRGLGATADYLRRFVLNNHHSAKAEAKAEQSASL